MFLEYSQPDPDAQDLDSIEEHETIIGVQAIKPEEDTDAGETHEAIGVSSARSVSSDEQFAIGSGEPRALVTAGVSSQSTANAEINNHTGIKPPQGSGTTTVREPSTTDVRTVATVSPVVTEPVRTSTEVISRRATSAENDDVYPRDNPTAIRKEQPSSNPNPRYRTTAEPIRLRWWYWVLAIVTLMPVVAGLLTYGVGTAVPTNVMMALLAVTGILASLQMVITSGVRMPAWATFMLVFPMAAGVMGGGALAAALVGPTASLQDLGKALAPGLVPLAILVAAGVSIRRTWRFWVAAHLLTSAVSTCDIVNAFILTK
jgi:hypothetical protein